MKNLEGLYFFQFSQGEYSDYSVGGLYVCDHEVTEDEWKEHYLIYQQIAKEHAKTRPVIRYPAKVLAREEDSKKYWEWYQWFEDNSPEKSFVELHNMVEVDCVGLHRDYLTW